MNEPSQNTHKINLRRGLTRFWAVTSIVWVISMSLFQQDRLFATKADYTLSGTQDVRPGVYIPQKAFRGEGDYGQLVASDYPQIVAWEIVVKSWAWVIFPPVALWFFGVAFFWVKRGFESDKTTPS